MRWIGVANFLLLSLLVVATCLFLISFKQEEIPVFVPRVEPKELPKSPFASYDEFFPEISNSLLALKWVPPQMQLPDLRQELLFCGKNARPDSLASKASFYFSLKTAQERALIREGERSYLIYQGICLPKGQRKLSQEAHVGDSEPLWGEATSAAVEEKNPYVFSPGNQPTPLWFETKDLGNQTVEVRVSMLDEKGALVTTPAELRSFHLQLQESSKGPSQGWELGGQRVDATLLVRQKARWIGHDLFLEMHGGEEFAHATGKERVDFGEGSNLYSCFVSLGDFLVWKEGRWQLAENGETQLLPLMVVKKIEEKILTFELWDPEGKGKILLSLVHIRDHSPMPDLAQEFKFVGAKTWAQFIVECRPGLRMTLKPHDWLVLTQEGWVKLDNSAQVDAYVEQRLAGPLFILEKMAKVNGRQVLIGQLFNAARTEMEAVELASASSPSPLANFYRHLSNTPPLQPKMHPSMEEGEE